MPTWAVKHAGDSFRDPRHLDWEYGNSDFDARRRFVFSSVYQLPFGRGKGFGSKMNSFVNALLGGWQLIGIFSLQTGFWYTPFGINDSCFCNDGNANSLRPDVVTGQDPNNGPKTPAEWFDTGAFTANVPAGRHGDAGRNIIVGPSFTNLDMGSTKISSSTNGRGCSSAANSLTSRTIPISISRCCRCQTRTLGRFKTASRRVRSSFL